ncbi:unnamed protein product [Pieris macdunnoughi]|uniref:HTH CENPB-type domain-containing protein n=1 Tax=Pieris macdunnoughi TaxID=345717 RepID=A0A821TE93_9NEOP|nr:unnamed protein product [Pieris macdunnoughi]
MEKLLYTWIQDQNQRQVPLSLAIIQNKALSIINTLQNKRGENNSEETKCFSASRGWYIRFKTRYSLHKIRVQEEAASADHVAAQSFSGILKEIIESGYYSHKQIFNVDETGLFWKKMPSRTFISQEEKSMPGFKAAKDRLTLLLGSNVEGDLKLKPLLVYRSEDPRALNNYVKSTLPVIWKANPKAWVTSILFEEWFTKHFIPEVKQYCLNNNLAYKALLILDNAPGHPLRIADIDPQIKVLFLPPNTTSLLQPMDQGVIASFKAYYLRKTFSQAVKANKNDGMELRDFWKSYNILQCPSESSSTDQPNIDEITTDIVHLANRLPDIAVTADDIDDLLSSHSQELTDEDLIELEAQKKIIKNSSITYTTPKETLFGIPKYAKALTQVAESRGIAVNYKLELKEVTPRNAVFIGNGGQTVILPYTFMHVTPPMSPPTCLTKCTELASKGYLEVDKHTLQHKRYSNVFGIGDCINTPSSKTAAAVANQSNVVAQNLWNSMYGKPLIAKYDGYGACPILTSYKRGIIAEFKYDGKIAETLPFDQAKERRICFYLQNNVFPYLYWNRLLKGKWNGPGTIRKIINPFAKQTREK